MVGLNRRYQTLSIIHNSIGFGWIQSEELFDTQLKNGTALAYTDSQCFFGAIDDCGLDHDKEEWERISRLSTGALTGAVYC